MVKEVIKWLFPKSVFSIEAEVHREYAKLGVRRRFKQLPLEPQKEGVLPQINKLEIEAYIER